VGEAKDWPSSLTDVRMSVSVLLLSHTHINARRENFTTYNLRHEISIDFKLYLFNSIFLLKIAEMP